MRPDTRRRDMRRRHSNNNNTKESSNRRSRKNNREVHNPKNTNIKRDNNETHNNPGNPTQNPRRERNKEAKPQARRWYVDPRTQCEIIYFYNPAVKRFIVMLRDIATKRFIRQLKELYVCLVRSFDTRDPETGEWKYPSPKNPDPTKNIWIECSQTAKLTEKDWKTFQYYEEFKNLIEKTARMLDKDCEKCWKLFEQPNAPAPRVPRVIGYMVSTEPCEEYCCYLRPKKKDAVALDEFKIRCYEKKLCQEYMRIREVREEGEIKVEKEKLILCPEKYGYLDEETRRELYKQMLAEIYGVVAVRTKTEVIYDDVPW